MRRAAVMVVAAAFGLASCGSSEPTTSSTSTLPPLTQPPVPTTTTLPAPQMGPDYKSMALRSACSVRSAVHDDVAALQSHRATQAAVAQNLTSTTFVLQAAAFDLKASGESADLAAAVDAANRAIQSLIDMLEGGRSSAPLSAYEQQASNAVDGFPC